MKKLHADGNRRFKYLAFAWATKKYRPKYEEEQDGLTLKRKGGMPHQKSEIQIANIKSMRFCNLQINILYIR